MHQVHHRDIVSIIIYTKISIEVDIFDFFFIPRYCSFLSMQGATVLSLLSMSMYRSCAIWPEISSVSHSFIIEGLLLEIMLLQKSSPRTCRAFRITFLSLYSFFYFTLISNNIIMAFSPRHKPVHKWHPYPYHPNGRIQVLPHGLCFSQDSILPRSRWVFPCSSHCWNHQ